MTFYDTSISRRQFLLTSGLLLLSARGVYGEQAGDREVNLFIDESGVRGDPDPFVIGALFTHDPAYHVRNISKIRKKHRFWLALRYNSSNRYKLPFAQDLLEYFFNQADLNFAAAAFTTAENQNSLQNPTSSQIAYHDWYRKLILSNTGKGGDLKIHLVLQRTTGQDAHLHNYLQKELKRPAVIQGVMRNRNDLIQLANLLTGSIIGDSSKRVLWRVHDRTKVRLLDQLKDKLSVKSLWDKSLSNHKKFRVTLGSFSNKISAEALNQWQRAQ